MGLGKLLNRSIEYQVTNTETGWQETFTIDGRPPLAPDWVTGGVRGMQVPGAWRAATMIADLIGSFPWHCFREDGDVATKIPTPPILDQPAPPDTRMTTFSSMALDLVWNGNAVGLIASRDAHGYPTSILPVHAREVGVRRNDSDGVIEYSYRSGVYAAFDVVHIKGPCEPGDLRGLGVLELHMDTLGLAREQERQAGSLAKHGVPTGLLKLTNPDSTKAAAEEVKEKWLNAQRTRTVAVLNATTEFEPLAWNAEELQLVEARRFTREELALIFGLPPRYLLASSGNSMTYSTLESERLDLLQTSSIVGHLARFEATLTAHRPRGEFVRANVDSWLRADTTTRYNAHKVGIDAGFLTVDEARALEDLPPLGGESADLVSAREMTRLVQQVYLGVGKVLSVDEARGLLNAAGANLPIPAPTEATVALLPQTPDTTTEQQEDGDE